MVRGGSLSISLGFGNLLDISKPITFADGSSPLLIWLELHSNLLMWNRAYLHSSEGAAKGNMASRAISEQRQLLGKLSTFPSARWINICDGQGWTPAGCAALSWCQDASMETVLSYWARLGEIPAIDVGVYFPGRILNPSLLPENKLSTMFQMANSSYGLALLLSARIEKPTIDISQHTVDALPQELQEMIDMRR